MPLPEIRQRPVVAVIGGASCTAQEDTWAEAVGRALAERGGRFADAIFRTDTPAEAVEWVLGELEKIQP